MTNKLKLISGVILLFFVGALAGSLGSGIYFKYRVKRFTGPGPQVPVRVQILLGRFSDELDLTHSQRMKIEEIVEDSQEQILALGRELFPEIEKINQKSWELVKAELDDGQKKKLDELYQKMRGFRDMGPLQPSETRGRKAGPVNGDWKAFLNLTREQDVKVRAIMEAKEKERENILEKYRGEGSQDFIAMGNEIRELNKTYDEKLREVLTKKQMQKYLETKEEYPDKARRMPENENLPGIPEGEIPPQGVPKSDVDPGAPPAGAPEQGSPPPKIPNDENAETLSLSNG